MDITNHAGRKEGLALVAAAVGIEHDGVLLGSTLSGGVILKNRGGYWNPLTDDGDSRCLQLALDIDLYIRHEWVEAVGPMTAACKVHYLIDSAEGDGMKPAINKAAAARIAVFEAGVLLAEQREERKRRIG